MLGRATVCWRITVAIVATACVCCECRGGDPDGVGDTRLAVPGSDALASAESRVLKIYGDRVRKGASRDEKRAAAEKLVADSAQSGSDPAAVYSMLALALRWYQEAEDIDSAMKTIDSIAKRFRISAVAMKVDLLKTMGEIRRGSKSDGPDLRVLLGTVFSVIDEAVLEDDYENARLLLRMGAAVAKRTRDALALKELASRERHVVQVAKDYERIRAAMGAIRSDPHDGGANQAVGLWLALSKDRWERALPYLAKAADAGIAEAAKSDLRQPKETAKQIALGDQWYRLSDCDDAVRAAGFASRSAFWYQAASSRLSGIEKVAVEQKAADALAKQLGTSSRQGVIEPGNVALASRGCKIEGDGTNKEAMIDGDTKFDANAGAGYVRGKQPCELVAVLPKAYQLREIRLRLVTLNTDYVQYQVAISRDGRQFTTVCDRRQGAWRGWQQITLPPTPVKAIKFIGLYHSVYADLGVAELEAYCIPPATMPQQ